MYIKPPVSEINIQLRQPTRVYPKRKFLTLKNILRVIAMCIGALAFLFVTYVAALLCAVAAIS